MSNNRRNRKTAKGDRQGVMGKARAQMKLSANVTEEQDWYLDTPDVRLTRIFTVVILLHAVAIGGILAFKMVDKASETSGIKISTARQNFESAVQEAKELAAEVPVTATSTTAAAPSAAAPVEMQAMHAPAEPLRADPSKGEQYRVQAGDTLPEIADELGVSAAALREKNAIRSDNELYPGRWLTIPGKGETSADSNDKKVATTPPVASVAAVAPVVKPESNSNPASYQVKPGDTAWAISRKFNVPFNKLLSENGIKNAEALQIGRELRIPADN